MTQGSRGADARARAFEPPNAAGERRGSSARVLDTAGAVLPARWPRISAFGGWLGGSSRLGLVAMALLVGGVSGLGAAGFRWLIFAITWLVTGHQQFGQQGHVGSPHLPGLGFWFVLLVPVLGGLLYGPLIQRYAREARGHGVPEVMVAVAENGGRIRPPVTLVKALASAVCIGTGGSVGREGPIVQIGSAMASSLGQLVRMAEGRLRVIVACGAAGGIAATFNAPITGVFFGFEVVLREFSLDAILGTILAAVSADLVSRAFFGSAPFFSAVPHDLLAPHDAAYLLVALLGICAGVIGVGFKTVLYRMEDFADERWRGRPEWARPAAGGVLLGLLLLALPQMYGVGYPVMDKVFAGHVAVWLMVIFMFAKIGAASLTLSIGGSGGVFAPSLFTGAAGGMAFGTAANHLFGASVGPPALYGVVAMGGVFAAASQAPLTAIASVIEMTGNFGITLSIMLAAGIASGISKQISYGSIYTTKLLRRGIDIERPRGIRALEKLTVADAMQPIRQPDGSAPAIDHVSMGPDDRAQALARWEELVGPVASAREPQALFEDEDLEHALRQLILYGRDGLPVVSHDEQRLCGWLTRNNVLRVLEGRVLEALADMDQGPATAHARAQTAPVQVPSTPLQGYELVELVVGGDSPALGRRLDEVPWPAGCRPVAVTRQREILAAREDLELDAGERVILLAPTGGRNGSSAQDPES